MVHAALLSLLYLINPHWVTGHVRCPLTSYPLTVKQFWGQNIRGGSTQLSASASAAGAATASSIGDDTTLKTNANANVNATHIPCWKQKLPSPLCQKSNRTLQRISIPYQDQTAEIYLLGTAHVSNDSSRDVKLLLQALHPDVIFVELCDQRTSLMEDPPEVLETMNRTLPFWDKVKEVQVQTNNSKFQSIANVLLTQTQEEYADSLGVELGGEFRAAYQYWRSSAAVMPSSSRTPSFAYKRPHLILGDRPLAITLARCWESLSWFGKIKVLLGLIFSSFHKPNPEELRAWIQKILEDDETDLLKASLEDLRKHFPTLERVIIRERDAYMACKLYQLCRGMLVSAARSNRDSSSLSVSGSPQLSSTGSSIDPRREHASSDSRSQGYLEAQRKPIVVAALVGAGHVPGICAWLTNKSHPQGPEEMLAELVATKKFRHEDFSQLIYDVTELQDIEAN